MTAVVLPIEAIVSDPDVRGGRPTITGTRICVAYVAARHHFEGLSPEAIATQYALTLGQVHAALAYYYMHKAELDDEMHRDADEAKKLLADFDRDGKLIVIE